MLLLLLALLAVCSQVSAQSAGSQIMLQQAMFGCRDMTTLLAIETATETITDPIPVIERFTRDGSCRDFFSGQTVVIADQAGSTFCLQSGNDQRCYWATSRQKLLSSIKNYKDDGFRYPPQK